MRTAIESSKDTSRIIVDVLAVANRRQGSMVLIWT